MASTPRYRFGLQQLRQFPVDSATVVELSDLMYWDTDDAKPVSYYDNGSGSEAADLAAITNLFIGVSNSKSAAGDTDEIDIDMSSQSVYEFVLVSSTYNPTTRLAVEFSGGALLDQTLQVTSTAAHTVGWAVNRATSASTSVKCTLNSAYGSSSSNAAAQS